MLRVNEERKYEFFVALKKGKEGVDFEDENFNWNFEEIEIKLNAYEISKEDCIGARLFLFCGIFLKNRDDFAKFFEIAPYLPH